VVWDPLRARNFPRTMRRSKDIPLVPTPVWARSWA
jgi:hypothetical protein